MRPITFFDVETTGLSHEDRVVSIGALFIDDESALARGECSPRATHLVFNPQRNSHPRARKVHGYADALLALQDRFADHAAELGQLFTHGGAAVAHNASFDRRFIANELRTANRPDPDVKFQCTMLMHRQKYGSPSGLDAVLQQMAFEPRSGTHGALTDAWYAMAIYCWLNEWPVPAVSEIPRTAPNNLRATATSPRTAAPPPIAAPAPIVRPSHEIRREYSSAFDLLRPLTTFLVAIARADGDVLEAEVEVISLLMHTMLEGRQARLTDHEHQDLLAALVGINPTAADMDEAALAVVRSPSLRQAAGGWIRQITMADGASTPAELQVINDIASRLRRARELPQIGT